MPKTNEPATSEVLVETGEAASPTKRTRKSGPRQAKPTYVLFTVSDRDGNPVEGAKLNVILATKDTEAVMNALDENKDAIRTKISL